MKLQGEFTIQASPEEAWERLVNPVVLKACIPGCELLESSSADTYRMVLTASLSVFKGRFTGTVMLKEQKPPQSLKLVVEGKSTVGFVQGTGTLTLAPRGDATLIRVDGDVQVGGTLARVGQRALAPAADAMLKRFFSCLEKNGRRA
ncbi:MAG: carbon monoxide dehydrogenase [Dehalococcoidia bacterium]|nr:carbon monoxide dehydrogenase [Dehalococcoidia bacterium]